MVHVGSHGEHLVGGSHAAGHEAWPFWGGGRVSLAAGYPRPFQGHAPGLVGQPIVGLRHPLGRKGIGLDQVGPRLKVAAVDAGHNVGPRQAQQVVVALELAVPACKVPPPEVLLRESAPLQAGAHGPVEDDDLALCRLLNGHIARLILETRSISLRSSFSLRLCRLS